MKIDPSCSKMPLAVIGQGDAARGVYPGQASILHALTGKPDGLDEAVQQATPAQLAALLAMGDGESRATTPRRDVYEDEWDKNGPLPEADTIGDGSTPRRDVPGGFLLLGRRPRRLSGMLDPSAGMPMPRAHWTRFDVAVVAFIAGFVCGMALLAVGYRVWGPS